MNAETIHDALSLLPSDLIAETDAIRRHPRPIPWHRPAAAAACAALLLAGALMLPLPEKSAKPILEHAACDAAPAEAPMAAPLLDRTVDFETAFTLEGFTVLPREAGTGSSACFSKVYEDIPALAAEAAHIVVGTVQDLCYTDEDAAPRTVSTFLVTESLAGDIAPNTLISLGESGGYVRLNTFIQVYGDDHFSGLTQEEIQSTVFALSLFGAPMTEAGDQYVLFLTDKKAEGRMAGTYGIIGGFQGKFILDPSTGRYARWPADDLFQEEEPMTLEELKARLPA